MTAQIIIKLFEEYMKNRGFSGQTVIRYRRETRFFLNWLSDYPRTHDVREVDARDIAEYRAFLYAYRRNGKGLGDSTRWGMLMSVRHLFKFLSKNEYIIRNPFEGLDMKSIRVQRLRGSIPEKHMHIFLDGINGTRITAIRDRALFELMYGTGLRISEIVNLNVTDIDLASGKLLVREGKGKRDRVVPLGENAAEWVSRYLEQARPKFGMYRAEGPDREALFLTIMGKRVSWASINGQLKRLFDQTGFDGKKVSSHLLRHSFATHMLEHGAGVKHVKEILGHKCFESTVGYTHFSVSSLKRIVRRYHPRENDLYVELIDWELLVRLLKGVA